MSRQRRSLPEWMRKVDADMRRYMIYKKTIEHQFNIIDGIRLDGSRITPVYELREGSSGGDGTCQTERTVMELITCNERIKAAQRYRATIEGIVHTVAGGDVDKLTFIQRYWWANESPLVRVRTAMVIDALPFLAYRNKHNHLQPSGPGRNFFVWRKEIYQSLAELMGHWERP